MNRILIAILVTLNFQACVQVQEKVLLEKPKVDKRVELVSIVFRLAERPEYSGKVFLPYTDRIEQHFEKHKNHELIQFTKSIIDERGITYDAPMWMAVHLDANLKLLTDVKEDIWQKDERWTKEITEKFVLLLQQFAKDTHFDDFFKYNADLYDEVIKRFATVYEQVDLSWYLTFYGQEPTETFSIIIGAGNGTSNYGPPIGFTDGSRNVYAIMGGLGGVYEYGTFAWLVIIHEFNHSFVNWLIYKNVEAFRESGEKIFPVIKDVLANQAYGDWETMMCEALVRAAEIKYLKDKDFEQEIIEEKINREKNNGFFWIENLVAELDSYDKQRDIYPTLESYMPRLIEAYKIWAENSQNK
jgi:uncharacterized protein YihD (DUF1040 family)